jgi:hypothetical protein
LLTGGVKAVEDIIKALQTFLTKPGTVLKDLLQTAGRKTVAVIETVIDFIATMARKLKNGAVKLFEDFKQFIDDVFKWLEELFGVTRKTDWLSSGIFKFGNDGKTFRNFLNLRERADDGWYNILCHGEPERIIIDGRKLKPEDFAKKLLDEGYEKGKPIRLIAFETGVKPNGFAAKLAKILETKIIAPTEKISVNELGEFVHYKKGEFVEFNK